MTRSARRWGIAGAATALAVAITAALLPAGGAAADPTGPSTPPSVPVGGGAGLDPVAQLTLPDVVMALGTITVVGDESTGNVVSQEIRIDGPGMFVTVPCGPPGPDCVVQFRTFEGAYTVTLTVFGPAGETSSDTETVTVFPRTGCPPMCPQPGPTQSGMPLR